jgi:hypothetical protein
MVEFLCRILGMLAAVVQRFDQRGAGGDRRLAAWCVIGKT